MSGPSDASSNSTTQKTPRFTTTAVINCSAYPPPQKRIITQTSSLRDEISSAPSSGRNFTASNGHGKSFDETFPRKVQVGESVDDRATSKKPSLGVPCAPPPPPSMLKSPPPPPSMLKFPSSSGESVPRRFPNARFAQTTNSLPRGYSPKSSGAGPFSSVSSSSQTGGSNFGGLASGVGNHGGGVGHHEGGVGHHGGGVGHHGGGVGHHGGPSASGIGHHGYQAQPNTNSNNGTNSNNSSNGKFAVNSNNTSNGNFAGNGNLAGKQKVDTSDPQVRKLVYNMYRGLLDNKHAHSNNIIDNKPAVQVDTDEGVKNRVLSMMKQQEELKSGKISTMNGPAGPPPPPPPPPFVVPGATPPPVMQAAPVLARPSPRPGPQVPQVAPPAALAGAMMKDKKPFTYTPGGLDLSEISPAPAPDAGAPVQSRSFRVLQQVVDNEASEPQAVDHASKAAQQQQQQARSFGNNSSAIPSRAFRALQQQTGGGDADAEVPRLGAPVRHNSLTSSSSFHPTSSSVFLNVSDKSTGNVGSTSQRHPESIHKNSAPQIIVNNGIKPKNVNSALTKQREASPSRWHVSTSNVTHDETPRGASPLVEEQSRLLKFLGEEAADSANKNGTPTMEPKKLYGGAKIPSRVFKHLQTEFSDASASAQPSTRNSRENLSPVGADKPQLSAGLLRLLQSDQNKLQSDKSDGDGSCVSSSYGEIDEYYSNGMANTAARKESVLRELTTQFDPFTECRKPKAVPGKVFRYLQQHYDTPDNGTAFRPLNNAHNGNISNSNKFSSEMEERKPKPSRFHSPSFNILQNQYKNDEPSSNGLKLVTRRISLEKQDPINCNDPHDLTSLRITEEGDPVHSKPYVGKRIPGKTFRMLQENYTNHPSVLQARK